MSAVFGIIYLEGMKIPDEEFNILKTGFSGCMIDRYEELRDNEVWFGNGIQYFTDTSELEKGPESNEGVFFVCDSMLDNRAEIADRLGLADRQDSLSDSELIRLYYENCREESLDRMLGAYVFVRYDRKTMELQIVNDAVGNRFVYYMFHDGCLYFSSLLKPLADIRDRYKVKRLNKKYMADYLAQDNLNAFTDAESTPYEGIMRIAPGTVITVSPKKDSPVFFRGKAKITCEATGRICEMYVQKYRYWDPVRDRKKLRLKNDDEYRKAFRELYGQCVRDVLRSYGEVSILLSAGFDSTSVAVLAEPELAARGKKLYSFTSVPHRDYDGSADEGYMADETEGVKKTTALLPGIEPFFMDMPDKNGWDGRLDYMPVSEIPYKSPQNMLWIAEGCRLSRERNARIMLQGAFGNGSVSYDNTRVYLAWLCRTFRWKRLWDEINGMNRVYGFTRKSMLKTAMLEALGSRKYYPRKTPPSSEAETVCFLNRKCVDAYKSDAWLKERDGLIVKCMNRPKRYHAAFFPIETLRHYGEFSQKNSLYYGVIERDPTRDKRILEFSLAVPEDQFTHNGIRRRLIREYMSDLIPEHILKEKRQGRQSADYIFRLCSQEERIKKELTALFTDCAGIAAVTEFIDCGRVLKFIADRPFKERTDFEMIRLLYTAMTAEFLMNFRGN